MTSVTSKTTIHNRFKLNPEAAASINRQKVLGAIARLAAQGHPFDKRDVERLAFPRESGRGRLRGYIDRCLVCSEAYDSAQRRVAG